MALVPDSGEQWNVDKVQDVAPNSNARMNVIGVGTGATAESEGITMATAKASEVAEARVTGTLSQPAADTDRLDATMTFSGADKTVTQVFRTNQATPAGTGETLGFYALYAGVPVSAADSIQYLLDIVTAGS